MAGELQWPVKFYIKPDGSKMFFRVIICESKSYMHLLYVEICKQQKMVEASGSHKNKYGIAKKGTYDSKPVFDGIVMPHFYINKKTGKTIKYGWVGTILLYRKKLGSGIIAHEFGHAAFPFERVRNGINDVNLGKENNEVEERCLYDQASMVRKFVKKCYAIGVY